MRTTIDEAAEKAAIESAVSKLANTMRMYVELYMRFNELMLIDREEAINNMDRAFETKLEAFHALYDVSKSVFGYFGHGDTALLIAVRNALHHRNHPLFKSLQARLFLEEGSKSWMGASFLLATYPTLHGAPIQMQHLVRLDDLDARMNPKTLSPYLDKSTKGVHLEERFRLVDRDLALATIRAVALRDRYPQDQVYLDLMPVFTSAVVRVFKAMKSADIRFRGFDADTYSVPFTSEIEVDLSRPRLSIFRV